MKIVLPFQKGGACTKETNSWLFGQCPLLISQQIPLAKVIFNQN